MMPIQVNGSKKSTFRYGFAPFIARILVGIFFFLAGTGLIFDFKGGLEAVGQIGIEDGQGFVVLGIIFQLVGSILLVLGLFTGVACWILFIFLAPLTFVFHSFWNMGGYQQALQFSLFLKNISILGSLIYISCFGPGLWSLDAYRNRKNFSKK